MVIKWNFSKFLKCQNRGGTGEIRHWWGHLKYYIKWLDFYTVLRSSLRFWSKMVIFHNSRKIAVFWHFFRIFGSILTNLIKSSFVAFRNQLSMFVTHGTLTTHECNVLNRIESNCSKIFIKSKKFLPKLSFHFDHIYIAPSFSLTHVCLSTVRLVYSASYTAISFTCLLRSTAISLRREVTGLRSYAESGCTDLFSFYRVSDATVHVHASSALVHLH